MKAWPMYAAIALTVLFAALSAGLMFYPVEVVATTAPAVVAAPGTGRDLGSAITDGVPTQVSEAFTWGLGTGVALTLLFVLSPFPRLRYK